MAQLLDALDARLVAVLEQARGASGLGPTAAARYVPAGRFRAAAQGQSPRDPNYPLARFDRAYWVDYAGLADEPDPRNPQDALLLQAVRFVLTVGYVYGADNARHVLTASGTDDAATDVQAVRRRALGEADALLAALNTPDIFADNATDPVLLDCWREGASGVEDLGGGRLLCVTEYRARIVSSSTSRYWP